MKRVPRTGWWPGSLMVLAVVVGTVSLSPAWSVSGAGPVLAHADRAADAGIDPVAGSARSEVQTMGRLVPIEPCRLLDSRRDTPLPASASLDVLVVGRCAVPDDAIAVAVTVTSVGAERDGWLAVKPTASHSAEVSTLNVARGDVRANSTVVSVGDGGSITLESDAGGHALIDVTSVFVPATEATSGRFVPVEPRRLVDTRGDGWSGGERTLEVPLPSGVPGDATALVVNVTIAGSQQFAGGFVSAHASGRPRPDTSIQNTDGWSQLRAATTIVPASPGGIAVYSSMGDPLLVDLVGYFTGPSAGSSDSGLFVPVRPSRVVDTRRESSPLRRAETRTWQLDVDGFNTDRAAAVIGSLTMVAPRHAGWMVASAAGVPSPPTSSVNAVVREVAANMFVSELSDAGLAVHASDGAHALVDVTGWFTGTPRPVSLADDGGGARPVPRTTLIISDSTGAAMRWYPEALGYLTGGEFVIDLESCRRTIAMSCIGREGYRPSTTLEAVNAAPPGIDTLVIMTGYNDRPDDLRRGIDEVVRAAIDRGVERIAWLTLRTNTTYSMPGQPGSSANDYQWGNLALSIAAQRYRELDLMDWNMFGHQRPEWFFPDGAHISPLGAIVLATFISKELERLFG